MKVLLIRHGQTDWNIAKKIQGSCDIELNEVGIDQAKVMSEKVIAGKYNITKIYSSSQKRAVKTAYILSKAINVQYTEMDDLQEINFGEWEGLSWEEVKEKYPAEFNKWFINRRYTKPPKGESYEDMLKRVLRAINKIITENSDDVAIVTHSAVIMCLQCCLTETPFDSMTNFKVDNTSIVAIDSSLLRNLLETV